MKIIYSYPSPPNGWRWGLMMIMKDSKDHIDAPSCLPIALSGCGSCETCIAVTGTRSGRIGRLRLPPTPRTLSGYGPHSTPSLAAAELTNKQILHLSQLMTFWLRSPPKSPESDKTLPALPHRSTTLQTAVFLPWSPSPVQSCAASFSPLHQN